MGFPLQGMTFGIRAAVVPGASGIRVGLEKKKS